MFVFFHLNVNLNGTLTSEKLFDSDEIDETESNSLSPETPVSRGTDESEIETSPSRRSNNIDNERNENDTVKVGFTKRDEPEDWDFIDVDGEN